MKRILRCAFIALLYSLATETSAETDPAAVPFAYDAGSRDERVSGKSPWLAFGLSYVFPGLGQLYNGQYVKAVVFPTIVCLGAALMMVSSPGADFSADDTSYPLLYAGVGLAGGAYIWSLVDAPVSANKINGRRQAQAGIPLVSPEGGNYALTLKRDPLLRCYRVELAITF